MCSDILCSFGILRSDSTSKTHNYIERRAHNYIESRAHNYIESRAQKNVESRAQKSYWETRSTLDEFPSRWSLSGGGGCVEMNHSTTWSTIPFVLRANSLMQSAQFRKDEILCLSMRFRIENSVSIALKKNRTPAAPRWGKENSGGRRGVCKDTSLVCIGLVFMGKCRISAFLQIITLSMYSTCSPRCVKLSS